MEQIKPSIKLENKKENERKIPEKITAPPKVEYVNAIFPEEEIKKIASNTILQKVEKNPSEKNKVNQPQINKKEEPKKPEIKTKIEQQKKVEQKPKRKSKNRNKN